MANLEEISASGINSNFTALNNELSTKADLNGNSSEIFEVANATTSTQAINKGQLDSAVATVDAELATKAELNGDSGETFEVANAAQSSQAVNKGQLDNAVSTISSDIDTMQNELDNITADGYRFPDYSSGVSKAWNTTYTAECDGWLKITATVLYGFAARATLTINNVVVWLRCGNNEVYGIYTGDIVPVSKGDVYIASGGVSSQSLTFYNCKGEN